MSELEALRGTILDAISVDLVHQSVVLEIKVTQTSKPNICHRLEFINVSDLRFLNRIPGPWNYAELTQIYVESTSDGRIKAEIVLWTEEASLEIHAETVVLDGVPLELAELP